MLLVWQAHSVAECVPQELLLALKRQTVPTATRRSPKGTLQPVATVTTYALPLQHTHTHTVWLSHSLWWRVAHTSPLPLLPACGQARPTSLHPPANAWNHSKQRTKFKHLTDAAPCVCGAGRSVVPHLLPSLLVCNKKAVGPSCTESLRCVR